MSPIEFVESLNGTGMFAESQELRKQSLKWWREMPLNDKKTLVKKYHKDIPFIAVSASSSKIERMFIKERDGEETT